MHHQTVRRNCGHHREVAAVDAAYPNKHTKHKEQPPMATTTPPGPGRLLSISDVAHQLGVDVRHVRRLVYEKRIPYIKWGHLLRFDPIEIASWIDVHRNHPSSG